MIYRLHPMQLAHSTTFEWSAASHKWEPTAMTMPAVEAHINVQNQDESHVMISNFNDITPANSDNGLCWDSTWYNERRTELPVKSVRSRLQSRNTNTLQPSHDGNRQSIRWWSRRRSNECSKTADSRVRSVKSYRQVKSPPEGSLPRHAPKSRLRVNQDSIEVAYWEHNHEVDRMVTEAEFERWFPSQW